MCNLRCDVLNLLSEKCPLIGQHRAVQPKGMGMPKPLIIIRNNYSFVILASKRLKNKFQGIEMVPIDNKNAIETHFFATSSPKKVIGGFLIGFWKSQLFSILLTRDLRFQS